MGKEADLPIQTVGECLREHAVAEVGQYLQYYKQLNWFNICSGIQQKTSKRTLANMMRECSGGSSSRLIQNITM